METWNRKEKERFTGNTMDLGPTISTGWPSNIQPTGKTGTPSRTREVPQWFDGRDTKGPMNCLAQLY